MKTDHPIQWVTPSPLWAMAGNDPVLMRRPALLRFNSDSFMEDLTALLQTTPKQLAGKIAAPTTYRGGPVGDGNGGQPFPAGAPLKLYQPVHGHFNLVGANLVCRSAGLPDRAVNTAQNEVVGFVLRQLDQNANEMAWIVGPPEKRGWLLLGDKLAGTVIAGEEVLPLFPVNYVDDAHRRRVLFGLIPTASREAYRSAARLSPAGAEGDPRLADAQIRIIDTLVDLKAAPTLPDDPVTGDNQAKEASRFLLLDLAEFLNQNLPGLWQAIYNAAQPPATDPGSDLYDLLSGKLASGATTWLTVLHTAFDESAIIKGDSIGTSSLTFTLKDTELDPQALHDALAKALGPPPANAPLPADLPAVPKIDPTADTLYVLRCVYQRPRCGVLHADVVSPPSEPFTLAPFFDFDAPSRPIRIPLPVDTSIAGLRKFAKNVGFIMSDKLRQKITSVADLNKALKGNLASGDTFSLGEICSFSIPIITICALVVLIIFILLLNIAFWWLPIFRICLPIPLKGK
jgi:hypothetical protein